MDKRVAAILVVLLAAVAPRGFAQEAAPEAEEPQVVAELPPETERADMDEDGLPDAWERRYGLDVGANDAQEDLDGDGYTNLQEFRAESDPADPRSLPGLTHRVNFFFDAVVGYLLTVLFWEIPVWRIEGSWTGVPLIVAVLALGGVFFTFRYRWVNIRLFRHSLDVIRGKYDLPEAEGEISHFQALTSALSATVGLGNIAGVAVAITAGGPGAVFWMWVAAVFGMSLKFSSCTLAQLYRRIPPDGKVLGGPMVYLKEGIRELHPFLAPAGAALGIVFAVLTVFASIGGGNLFQCNQTHAVATFLVPAYGAHQAFGWITGGVMAVLVGLVIIGGIRRIGEVTSRLVPAMCLIYVAVCLVIIAANFRQVPEMFGSIFSEAFNLRSAMVGGFIGVVLQGIRRAAFSNEAGLGSAAIAHAAARTKEPIREGVVAMLEPFIDTICVCTMTALTILITNTHLADFEGPESLRGAALTAQAFGTLHDFLPYVLGLAVFVFAYSTMISWSYYGERASEFLFGRRAVMPYRVIYVAIVVVGPVLSLDAVVLFADMMLLSMAFPNIIGQLLLAGRVNHLLEDYIGRLRAGELVPGEGPLDTEPEEEETDRL